VPLAACRVRRGYTLLELLVVLTVLAALAALSWPTVRRMMDRSDLRSAARELRATLLEARLEAIESGRTGWFRYRPGTGTFETSIAAVVDDGPVRPAAASDFDQRDAPRQAREGSLPAGVSFQSPARRQSPAEPNPMVDVPDEQGWSEPILLHPNGRTSNARIRLDSRRGYAIELTLRGFLGTAAIGPVEQVQLEEEGW
jgi:prepilin-type N-terminal cleavage/methylation domain-containing protein